MNEEKKKQIIDVLSRRVSGFACPICHQAKYSLIGGYSVDTVQKDYKGMEIGGIMIPSVILVCGNCGHIDKFSLGVLGLMEVEDNAKK